MASKGKKGGGPPAQQLSGKEIKRITNSMADFVQNPANKNAHFKTLGLKRNHAEEVFRGLRDSGKYPGGAHDPAAPPPTAPFTPSALAPPATAPPATANTSGDNQDENSGDQVLDAATEETSASTQVSTPAVNGENLVVRVNTDRKMPTERDGLQRRSSGELMEFDDFELTRKLSEVDEKPSPFPIRIDFQKPTSNIFTNCFRVSVDSKKTLHEFVVIGIPDGVSRTMKKFFVDTAIEKSTVLNNNKDSFATDYNKTIITWKEIRKDLNENARWDQRVRGWHLVDVKDGDNRVVTLFLKYIRDVDTKSLQRYVNTDPGDDDWNPLTWNQEADTNDSNKDTVLNALHIVISKCFGDGVFRLGPNKFFIETGSKPLGNSPLTAIRGYFYSIRPGMGHILLNVNACTSAFLQPVRLDVLLNEENQKLFGKDWPSFLTGLRVYIDYNRGRTSKARNSTMNKDESRIKKICGLGKPCNEQKFMLKNRDTEGNVISEQEIDVQSYLMSAYQIKLNNPGLQAINLGSRHKESWFAPETLVVMPYQIYSRAVPGKLMGDMHKVACNAPDKNRGLIEGEGMSKLLIKANPTPECPETIPIKVTPTMFRVHATTLKNPKINYRNERFPMPDSAQWDLAKKEFYSANSIRIPYLMIREDGVSTNNCEELQTNFQNQMSARGVGQARCVKELMVRFNKDTGSHEVPLRKKLQEAITTTTEEVALIILMLKYNDQDVYSAFKYLADRVFGFKTMVFVEKSNFKRNEWNTGGLDQYVGNVVMKANLKFDGINHFAESSNNVSKEWLGKTLVLGADVTHPSGGALPGCPSIAAVVGSTEVTGGRFLGSMQLQSEGNKEIIDADTLELMVHERISDWYYKNDHKYPENILYYRDGVSDSQYQTVKSQEIPPIQAAFDRFREETKSERMEHEKPSHDGSVKITAVVVTKRHHIRFYPRDEKDKQLGNGNCKPGTLVEQGVTSPYFTDFYLQSHNGIKGTAKPAHYWVLQNDMEIQMHALQNLTHNLCLSYVRATMGVSYAAPAYYADRLCERGRCYIREFLAPPQSARDDLDNQRRREERQRGLFPPKKFDKEAEKNKSREQKERERQDLKSKKEAVETALKKYVYDKAVERWDAVHEGDDYSEDYTRDLRKTMYWM